MAEVLNEYFSSAFTTEDIISSLPVPVGKVEGDKSGYLGQLIVTSSFRKEISKDYAAI